jgi:hypothetical protein
MAINNQTAVLKVVDNLVYFTVEVTPRSSRRAAPCPVRHHEDHAAARSGRIRHERDTPGAENDVVVR